MNVPEGWNESIIGDCSIVLTGGTPRRSNLDYWQGSIPWMSSGEIHQYRVSRTAEGITEKGLSESNARWLPVGTVMLALNGQGRTRGMAAILSTSVTCNQSLAGIIAESNILDREFLFQYMNSMYQKLRGLTGSAARNGLNLKLIRSFPILLPPLPEQKKIAAILSSVDETIQATRETIEQTKKVKKGLMQELLTKGIGHTKFIKTEIGEIPEEWEIQKLCSIAVYRRGSFPQPYGLAKWYDDENGHPFVQVYDIDTNLKLKKKTKRRISAEAAEKSVFAAKGTVLISLQGSIGRVAITQYDSFVDRTVLVINDYKLSIHINFFAVSIEKLFAVKKESAPGGTIKTITKAVLDDFVIPLPPLSEQKKIASILVSIDAQIQSGESNLQQLQQLKKGLMQDLLTGKVRVKA